MEVETLVKPGINYNLEKNITSPHLFYLYLLYCLPSLFISASISLSGKRSQSWKVSRFGNFLKFNSLQICCSVFQ